MANANPIPETYRAPDWPRKVARKVNDLAARIDTLGTISGGSYTLDDGTASASGGFTMDEGGA